MKPWLLRGIVMAIVQIAARSLLGIGIVTHPTSGTTQRFIAVAIVVGIAIVFAGYDGLVDARRYPKGDDGIDLINRWFKAAVFAGLASGAVAWILGTWVLSGIGQGAIWFELTVGAAFTALLIIIPAAIGTVIGRRLAPRRRAAAA